MMYAKQLLEDRDVVQVVATLLDLAAPEVRCAPKKVAGFDPTTERGQGRRNDRPDRGGRGDRPQRGGSNGAPPGRGTSADYTRFFVSWGEEGGATTGRLLGQICRRGGIESHQVGAIEVSGRVSFVGVANDVAAEFEKRAGRPDSRDPGIIIKRAEEKASGPGHAHIPRDNRGSGAPSGPRNGPKSFDRSHRGSSKAKPAAAPTDSRRPSGPSSGQAPRGRYPGSAAPAATSHGSQTPPTGPAKDGRRNQPSKPKGPGHKLSGGFKSKGPGHKPAK